MRCFVDMDGVLVDFVGGAMRRFERPISPWPAGEYDLPSVLGLSRQQFWSGLDERFWADLQPMADAADLLQLLEGTFGAMSICILSSPSLDPRCLSGKVKWLQRHLPKYKRRFLIGPCKEFCAGPDAVLLDDAEKNVAKFHRAGGGAMLVPRPWNRDHAITDPIASLRERLQAQDWQPPAPDDPPQITFDFD